MSTARVPGAVYPPVSTCATAGLALLAGVTIVLFDVSCVGSGTANDSVPATPAAEASREDVRQYAWAHAPGPIEGLWRPACRRLHGAEIEISLEEEGRAVGRISRLGPLEKSGYRRGEVIFRLRATKLGKWVGDYKRRTVLGDEQWQAIHFVAAAEVLEAVVTGDECYRRMDRK